MTYTYADMTADSRRAIRSLSRRQWRRIGCKALELAALLWPLKERSIIVAFGIAAASTAVC